MDPLVMELLRRYNETGDQAILDQLLELAAQGNEDARLAAVYAESPVSRQSRVRPEPRAGARRGEATSRATRADPFSSVVDAITDVDITAQIGPLLQSIVDMIGGGPSAAGAEPAATGRGREDTVRGANPSLGGLFSRRGRAMPSDATRTATPEHSVEDLMADLLGAREELNQTPASEMFSPMTGNDRWEGFKQLMDMARILNSVESTGRAPVLDQIFREIEEERMIEDLERITSMFHSRGGGSTILPQPQADSLASLWSNLAPKARSARP